MNNHLMDSNPKWRFNDIVFFEECGRCGIKIEWQHEEQSQNNRNNFRNFLWNKGWRKQWFFGWVCDKH
jgi:hypothetical protein